MRAHDPWFGGDGNRQQGRDDSSLESNPWLGFGGESWQQERDELSFEPGGGAGDVDSVDFGTIECFHGRSSRKARAAAYPYTYLARADGNAMLWLRSRR